MLLREAKKVRKRITGNSTSKVNMTQVCTLEQKLGKFSNNFSRIQIPPQKTAKATNYSPKTHETTKTHETPKSGFPKTLIKV